MCVAIARKEKSSWVDSRSLDIMHRQLAYHLPELPHRLLFKILLICAVSKELHDRAVLDMHGT